MSQECLQVNTWLKNWFYDESEVDSLVNSKSVTVEKKSTADTGFLASYVVKQGGSQVGATINIPKDFLVKSGSVKTCTVADQPVTGYVVGDKYLDLVINTKDGTGSDEHLYVLVSDLVDVPVDWSDIENKPSSYTPSAHNHGYLSETGEVTNTNMSRHITVPVGVDSYNKLVKANKMENTAIVQPTALSNIGTTGGATQTVVNGAIDTKIGSLENTIPSKTSDLINDGDDGSNVFVSDDDSRLSDARTPTSHTHGNLNNDGTITTAINPDSNNYPIVRDRTTNKIGYGLLSSAMVRSDDTLPNLRISASDSQNKINRMIDDAVGGLGDYIKKSNTSGLVKNDGTIDTNTYLTQHQDISGKVNTSDVVNNLTTTVSGKVLDARQGKALADLIGSAITYINQ